MNPRCLWGAPRVLMGDMNPHHPWGVPRVLTGVLGSQPPSLSRPLILQFHILSSLLSLMPTLFFLQNILLLFERERQRHTERQTHGRMGCTHAMMHIWRSEDNFVDLGLSATSVRVLGILAWWASLSLSFMSALFRGV